MLAVLICGALIGASSASAATVDVRDKAATGMLDVSAVSGPARTTVYASGRLRARRWLRWVAFRCATPSCRVVTAQGRAAQPISPGRRSIVRKLRVRRAPAVRLELRAGRRVVARRTIVPAERAPAAPPTVPGPEGDRPDERMVEEQPIGPPAPDVFALEISPGLQPDYDPQIADYTMRCTGDDVVFSAAVPLGHSVAVDGRPARTATSFTRAVPLQPNQAFGFAVTDGSGTHHHVVRCLPADFPTWTVEGGANPDAAWLAFAPALAGGAPYSIIADVRGVPVWWKRVVGAEPLDFKVLPDGTVAWGRSGGGQGYSATWYEHFTLSGKNLGNISTVGVGTDDHDLQVLPNGNRLVLAYRPREHVDLTSLGGPPDATVLDGEVQEVTPAGALVWSWNSKDHVALSETSSWGLGSTQVMAPDGGPAYDIVHLNSIEVDGDGLVLSARHLNAVFRIRRSDGAITWKLGGTQRPESLAFVGDAFPTTSFGGQHDARILADGSLTLLDNGTLRNRPPRALRYLLDTTARTATVLEDVRDSRTPGSNCCNSARRLPSGHWVVTNEAQRTVSELTAAGHPVMTLRFASGFTYRAIPYARGDLDRATLRGGMDAMHPR